MYGRLGRARLRAESMGVRGCRIPQRKARYRKYGPGESSDIPSPPRLTFWQRGDGRVGKCRWWLMAAASNDKMRSKLAW